MRCAVTAREPAYRQRFADVVRIEVRSSLRRSPKRSSAEAVGLGAG